MSTLKEIADKILEGRNTLLVTHVNPDGDGIGAVLALYLALNKLNKDRMKVVRIGIDDIIPSFLKFLPSTEVIENIHHIYEKEKFDVVVALDAASRHRIGSASKFIREETLFINIDHHMSNENYGKINYVDAEASSVSEVVYYLIKELGVEIDIPIAEALYCGIVNDTGNFSFNNVSEKTFSIAAELKKCGIDNEKISENLFSNKSLARIKLLSFVFDNMIFLEKEKLVYSLVTKEILDKYRAAKEDTDGLVEALRTYEACDVSMLLREDHDGKIKGSFRSKGKDVNRLAALFGGGGHIKAAGFNTDKKAEEVIEIIKQNWQ